MGAVRWMGGTPKVTFGVAVLGSSLVFSAAHYQPLLPTGETLAWATLGTFLFRVLAGVVFALLFVWRGFGIAAGSHALYDVISQELFNAL
jgi:membrane protease YdiL (CAAX protease family)